MMPSNKEWPPSDNAAHETYILDDHTLMVMNRNRFSADPFVAAAAEGIYHQHLAALSAMETLRDILDDYADGVKPA